MPVDLFPSAWLAAITSCLFACQPGVTSKPRPTPAPAPAPAPAPPEPFEPKLAWATDAPRFVPASEHGVVDERNLLHALGDGRYFGLMGVGEALPAYSHRAAASSEGLVVPNFLTLGDQNVSTVASFWDRDGHLVGHFEGLVDIFDIAAAPDAPLVAFAVGYYAFHQPGAFPYGVWLFNTRARRFYAPRLCDGLVAESVAITSSGEHLAATCARLDAGSKVPKVVDAELRVWDLRQAPPTARWVVALPERDWGAPYETMLPFGAKSLVISDDGARVALAMSKAMAVYDVGTSEPVRLLDASVPVAVDDRAVVVRAGEKYHELQRVQLDSGSAVTLATQVTAAVGDGDKLYWASGAQVAAIDETNMRLPAIDLRPAGVIAGGWPTQPWLPIVKGLTVQHPSEILAQVRFGPVVSIGADLSTLGYQSKLPGHPSEIAWTDDGAIELIAQYTRFRWTPGDKRVKRASVQPQSDGGGLDSANEARPWSFHRCDGFPLRWKDPQCVDIGGYIVSPCMRERPDRGVHAGYLIQDPDGPPRPRDPKVWSVRYTDHVEVKTWTAPRYASCVVSADTSRLLMSFDDGSLTLYSDTGEVIWQVAGVGAEEVLAFEHGHAIVSLGGGTIAWLDGSRSVRRTWKAHLTDCMLRAAIHPDGKSVATSSCDEALRIWKLAP